MQKVKVLIPDGESGPAVQVVRCLGRVSNYQVFVLSGYKGSLAGKSKYCSKFLTTVDSGYSKERLEKVLEIVKKYSIDFILPSFLPGFEFCLKYKEILEQVTRLPLITDRETYLSVAYKDTLVEVSKKYGIKTPRSINVADVNLLKEVETFKFPVLLKPSDQYSGGGIRQFESVMDFANELNTPDWIVEHDNYLVQEYLRMETVGVNVICQNGKSRACTIQRGLEPPPRKYSFSEAIQFIDNPKIFDFVQSIMSKLVWQGVTNIDILFDFETEEIYLLEINPRFWGTTLSGSERAGVNFPHLLIQLSMNPAFSDFPNSYDKIKYGKFTMDICRRIILKRSPIKLSETGFNFLFIDPIPTLFGFFY